MNYLNDLVFYQLVLFYVDVFYFYIFYYFYLFVSFFALHLTALYASSYFVEMGLVVVVRAVAVAEQDLLCRYLPHLPLAYRHRIAQLHRPKRKMRQSKTYLYIL